MKRAVLRWMHLVLLALALGCGEKPAREMEVKPARAIDGKSAREVPVRGKQLLIYCGAGLRPPVAELIEAFSRERGIEIAADYAGSEVMLSRIRLRQRGDLYLPGDRYYVAQAEREGLILEHKQICQFVPVILVQKGNPKRINGLHDLLRPGVRLGLGDARACAIGRVSKPVFEKNQISWGDVQRNLSYQSLTVNELGLQIEAATLDAVIVWGAVARYYAAVGDVVIIPRDKNVISSVEVAVLKCTRHPVAAKAFTQFLTSSRSRSVFAKHGYQVDRPAKGQETAKE